jgi:hypothetical protein
VTVPIGAWLTLKEFQFCEETSYGILPASPAFTPIGYEPRIMFRFDPRMLPVPQPGSEDPMTIQGGAANDITWDVTYRMTDSSFARYGINAQGGGSGTIDKSLALLMSVKLSATTETWIILQGARPYITTISGRAGGNLEARVIGKSQTMPIPVQSDPGYTYATSSTAQPIQLKDGGLTPLTIGGLSYDVNNITVNVNRNLSIIPQPGSHSPQIILPQNREVTGTFGICWETLALFSVLGTEASAPMVWTLSTSLNSTLTISSTQFTKLNSLQFSNGDPAVIENYAFQASATALT